MNFNILSCCYLVMYNFGATQEKHYYFPQTLLFLLFNLTTIKLQPAAAAKKSFEIFIFVCWNVQNWIFFLPLLLLWWNDNNNNIKMGCIRHRKWYFRLCMFVSVFSFKNPYQMQMWTFPHLSGPIINILYIRLFFSFAWVSHCFTKHALSNDVQHDIFKLINLQRLALD